MLLRFYFSVNKFGLKKDYWYIVSAIKIRVGVFWIGVYGGLREFRFLGGVGGGIFF